MRSSRERHPVFDGVVFGLAVLLAAIILFYAVKRTVERKGPSPESFIPRPGEAASGGASSTEMAVAEVPPIRLSRVGAQRARRIEVPAPPPPARKK